MRSAVACVAIAAIVILALNGSGTLAASAESILRILVAAAGAGIVFVEAMVAGLIVHKAMLRHAPSLASVLPGGALILIGSLIGAATVAQWFVPFMP